MTNSVFSNQVFKRANKMVGFIGLFLVVLTLGTNSASAACDGIGCACVPSVIQFASPTMQPAANGKYPISLEADDVEAQGEELVTLSGNAEVTQGRQTIVADQLQYYRQTDRVVASGNVEIISEEGDYMSSDSVDVIAPSQIGTLTNSEFRLASSLVSEGGIDTVAIAARGSAGVLNLEGEGVISMEDATYTTCPEGSKAVMVSASKLELDKNAGVAVARGATVRFYGVPLAYTPYISFPINDERKTGFLAPRWGSDEFSGTIIELPWYWNIARNQDATITPRHYTDRGTQLAAEYRRESLTSETLIYAEILPDDEIFGADRDLLTIEHAQEFTENLSGYIEYNDVSDSSYFNDLSNDVSRFSARYVPQTASLSYKPEYFNIKVRASEYQIVDPLILEENQPYERLPQVTFSTNLPDGPLGMEYGLDGSYTDFASNFMVEGTRTALSPYIGIPFKNIWGYIEPKLTVESRRYSLDNVAEGQDESPSFTVPVFSLDMGIALEKNTTWLGKKALHTLEPRVFYVYAPSEDQSGIPDFDTGAQSLNGFSGIFRASRFNGEDRVGDMNQITVGLTSEISDSETGDRRFKASIGQLYIIDDLEQHLNDTTVIESGLGDLLAEFKIEGEHAWSASSFIQYDHDEGDIEKFDLSFAYAPNKDTRKVVSVSYYLSKNFDSDTARDQIRLNARWPITDRWSFFGSERYSLEDSESLSTTIGFEYDGCCWKLRFIGAESARNGGLQDKNQSFFFEIELNSIGTIGQSIF